MKQILQNLKNGKLEIADLPLPAKKNGQLLIKTNYTLVSPGTERMLVEFGKANIVKKAQKQPEKVQMVIDKIKTDGLIPSINAVMNKLDRPLPLGYCNVGSVIDWGENVDGFEIGDRVISNGFHAEVVSVPKNLCAKVPDNVSDEEAAFTVLASIALQSIRLIKPTLGETVVVIGLGLVGLMAIQLLKASGCRVLGIDYDSKKLELAKQFGSEIVNLSENQDSIKAAEVYSKGRGVDAVIIAATTTSNSPIQQAASMCRKKGRIVLVGVTGLNLSREVFFKKELTFQVSSSYGPGRYDQNYEEKGQDYPFGYVRWTEQRNFEAVLDMMSEGKLNVKPLISHKFNISDAKKAYEFVVNKQYSLGILLKYNKVSLKQIDRTISFVPKFNKKNIVEKNINISFVGAGNYTTSTLIPNFNSSKVCLYNIASNSGITSSYAARKFGFQKSTTDNESIFNDTNTNAVIITTQHNSHAELVIKGLESGKHVFVEKPLCLTLLELKKIEKSYTKALRGEVSPILMVGFNRRFSSLINKTKSLIDSSPGPKSFIMTVNAGTIPKEHWTQDPISGGGRIIGEACHFIDLLRFLSNSQIKSWSKVIMKANTDDTVSINLRFKNGSIGTIHYFANGIRTYPKERLEIFTSGRILVLDNFRQLKGYGWPNFKSMKLWRQDKGQKACVQAFIEAITNKRMLPISIDELIEVSRVSIEVNN